METAGLGLLESCRENFPACPSLVAVAASITNQDSQDSQENGWAEERVAGYSSFGIDIVGNSAVVLEQSATAEVGSVKYFIEQSS